MGRYTNYLRYLSGYPHLALNLCSNDSKSIQKQFGELNHYTQSITISFDRLKVTNRIINWVCRASRFVNRTSFYLGISDISYKQLAKVIATFSHCKYVMISYKRITGDIKDFKFKSTLRFNQLVLTFRTTPSPSAYKEILTELCFNNPVLQQIGKLEID